MEENNTREKLAELSHTQWAGWMKHLFAKGKFNEDGTWTMPAWAVKRSRYQMETPYSKLSKEEQDSDRIEADKILKITGDKYEQLKVVVQDLLTEIGIVPSDLISIAKLADYESTHIGAKIKVSTAQKLLDADILDK